MTPVRAITYLVPGLPLGFFEAIVDALGPDASLIADGRASGPCAGEVDPFTAGSVDLGFMCAPAYLALRRQTDEPTVRLLGIAPIFNDPRSLGRPTYYADVVVRHDDPAVTFADLRGRTVGYNDAISLSGRLALLLHLADLGEDATYFSELVATGSHDASLQALHDGSIDVATMDSTTLRLRRAAQHPLAEAVRVIEGLGPHPIQPIVVRSTVSDDERLTMCTTLADFSASALGRKRLGEFGCLGFAGVSDASYAALDAALVRLQVESDTRP
jgi:phosphonate transport system substrate-binding protein